MTRHSVIRNVIRKLFSPKTPRTIRKAPVRQRLYLERLEERLAPAVDPQLSGGILDIGLNAANDQATVSVVGANIDVFDGTTHTDFAANSVNAINAHGNNASNQSVTFNSTITLAGALTVTALTNTTLNGAYTVQFAQLEDNGAINISSGANLTASGDINLVANDDTLGLTTTSSTQVTVSGATLQGDNVTLAATSTITPSATGLPVAVINGQSNALVSIDGSSQITAAGNVTIASASTVTSNAVASAAITDYVSLPVDADVATSTLVSSSIADVSGATAISAGGTSS